MQVCRQIGAVGPVLFALNRAAQGKGGAASHGASPPVGVGSSTIPRRGMWCGCRWSGAPKGTRSYVVTCFDPDAPTGSGFWHWAVANVPATVTSLPSGAGDPAAGLLPEGAITMPNETRAPEFIGAGPPAGTGVHHYWFVVHALSVDRIDIDPQATPAVLGFLMRDAVLARGILVATGEYGGAAS